MAGHQQQPDRPVAIVTGASTGIGEASARVLQAAWGYRVFGTYRRAPATICPRRTVQRLICDVMRASRSRSRCAKCWPGRAASIAGEQRRSRVVRKGAEEVVPGSGEIALRSQPVRDDPHDEGRPSRDVRRAAQGTHRQYQFDHGLIRLRIPRCTRSRSMPWGSAIPSPWTMRSGVPRSQGCALAPASPTRAPASRAT